MRQQGLWYPVWFAPPNYQEALLPCIDPRAITRAGTLFDKAVPVIDKRMTSERTPAGPPPDTDSHAKTLLIPQGY